MKSGEGIIKLLRDFLITNRLHYSHLNFSRSGNKRNYDHKTSTSGYMEMEILANKEHRLNTTTLLTL